MLVLIVKSVKGYRHLDVDDCRMFWFNINLFFNYTSFFGKKKNIAWPCMIRHDKNQINFIMDKIK